MIRTILIKNTVRLAGAITHHFKFFGFYTLCLYIAKILSNKKTIAANLANSNIFILNSIDPYWLRILYSKFVYEKEISQFLHNFERKFIFIDAGANIGYWTSLIGKNPNCKAVHSFEPNPSAFQLLKVNAELNSCPTFLHNSALTNSKRKFLYLKIRYGYQYDADATIARTSSSSNIKVSNTNFNDFFSQIINNEKCIIILKLDIEGEEINLFKSHQILNKKIVLIYEDHGKDRFSQNSSFLLDKGFLIYFLSKNSSPIQIKCVEQLTNLKTSKKIGYNCVAFPPDSELEQHLIKSKVVGRQGLEP